MAGQPVHGFSYTGAIAIAGWVNRNRQEFRGAVILKSGYDPFGKESTLSGCLAAAYAIIIESTDEKDREGLKRMLTQDEATAAAPIDSDDWVPDWWGSDEANAKEASAFTSWTRNLRPVQ